MILNKVIKISPYMPESNSYRLCATTQLSYSNTQKVCKFPSLRGQIVRDFSDNGITGRDVLLYIVEYVHFSPEWDSLISL